MSEEANKIWLRFRALFARAKTRVAAVALAACLLGIVAGGAVAFKQVVGTSENVISSGGLGLQLVERVAETGELILYQGDSVTITAAADHAQEVLVRNDGQHPFFVRVALSETFQSTGQSADHLITVRVDEEHWTLHTDGYYYYKTALANGQATEPLFQTVGVSTPENLAAGQQEVILFGVTAQAVQSENNGETDPLAAVGWPAA